MFFIHFFSLSFAKISPNVSRIKEVRHRRICGNL
ncbi:MAG: hypothetical protein ISS28_05495 [Candidatus Cloacimonetes bacterium]|nr:hypothetical protein [Candidatus Cloacimonadota bacterium]MBL7086534.1 hypothetical protein [Candidatus Cloacimonadota bacterium]